MEKKQILYKSLNDINIGEKVVVKEILSTGDIKRRLQDLGIIENTKIECVLKSPYNDPSAYLVRGTVIALRSEITKNILVK